MRKYIIICVALLSLVSANVASAQFRYGPMVGVSFTDLKFNQDIISVDGEAGFAGGLFSEMIFPGIGFGFDAGLIYNMKGAKINLGEKKIWSSDGYGNERCMLHYIGLPINLRFKYTNFGGFEDYVAPFVFAGPEFSFLVAHSKIDAFQYAVASVGLTVGLGAELFKNWQLSGGYTWGLSHAIKTVKLDDYCAYNRSWNIRLAYLF